MADIKELVKGLGQDQEAAYRADLAIRRALAEATAPDAGARRRELAEALAAELNAMTPATKDANGKEIPPAFVHSVPVRSRIALYLQYVGGTAEVPALVEAMKDLGVRDSARMALEANPSPEATGALIAALEQAGPVFLTGVINALGKRRGPEVGAALQKAAGYEDPEVRIAALNALANIPDPANDTVILKSTSAECPRESRLAQAARIRLADTLRADGNTAAAGRIYRSVLSGNAPDAQKKAARTALSASA